MGSWKGVPLEREFYADRPAYIERGGPVMEFRQAQRRVIKRRDAARAAGRDEEVRQLEEEAEVLEWKQRWAIRPGREIPAEIRAKFDLYPDHPTLRP